MDRIVWEDRLAAWRTRLRAWGLEDLAATLLEVAEPFSLIGAQALYVAQPALRLFVGDEDVGHLARLLEDPANVAWLREQLTGLNEDPSPDGHDR